MDDRFSSSEFAENPEPRCAVVLLLDTSASMRGRPINELNEGLRAFGQSLQADALASLRVDIALVTFGGTVSIMNIRMGSGAAHHDATSAFVSAGEYVPPTLQANGATPMGEAARLALALVQQRKDLYRLNAIDYYRPWILMISDGEPNDANWEAAAAQLRDEQGRKGVLFYAVAVGGANIQQLSSFCTVSQPLKLHNLAFSELFQWLSKSLSSVSQSKTGQQIMLPPVSGWAQIDA